MIKNYIKLGFRSLEKNKLSSIINILSLGLAVGCCMVVFEFIYWGTHMDNFHHKLNNLFVIERLTRQNGNEQLWGDSPAPIGPMLKNDFMQVKDIARVNDEDVIIKRDDNVFRETVTFADNALYQMFDFPVKWGNKANFTGPDGIVLTSDLAEKLFGDENPVGRNVNIRFIVDGRPKAENFTVKGVFDKRPDEASWYFSALIPYEKQIALGLAKPGDWSKSTGITFIEANNEASLKPVAAQIKKYLGLYDKANPYNKIIGFHIQPLKGMSFHAFHVNNRRFVITDIAPFIMMIVIAIATLLLVYFNYMNIAIASAFTRLKEIGIRKVMGSNRRQIILQFILENIILCTFAVLIGLALAKFLFLPGFSQIVNDPLGADLFTNPRTWAALIILILLSALGGAAYPAFYISAFNPVNIIKGDRKISGGNRFRKRLLGFQFFLTFWTLSMAIVFMQETPKVKSKPWGYSPAGYVVVNLDKSANYASFRDQLMNSGGVTSVTGAEQALGEYSKEIAVKYEAEEQTVQAINALPGFATQLGIRIVAGRDLNDQYETDKTAGALVNQAFVKQMHWKSAVGKNIEYQGKPYLIVGETNDFRFEDFKTPVAPLVITGCTSKDISYVYIKTSGGLFTKGHLAVGKIWKKINPNLPFEYHYQDSVFDDYFSGFEKVGQILSTAAGIMIIVSVSGIFGLALIILGRKMKEVSVRKVLGAGFADIALVIMREFLWAIGFAVVFGFPISWWLSGIMFRQISVETSVSLIPFVFTLGSLLLMTLMSVSWHIYRANTADPTEFLGNE